ncbi:MAG: MFS transporter [Mycobacteriaceae bacterium]|nr:MFS transporter [Mycobacteriaceae bacterium]
MSTSVDSGTAPPPDSVDVDAGRLDGASKARIFLILAVIVLFTEVAPMQFVMVSAALRQIAPTFPDQGANINWAIIIFGIIGAASAPLIGKMSDIWGKKRMFLTCGALFLIGSVICALTNVWLLFLVGRGLQATAIATATISYGLIRDLMPRRYVPIGLGIASTGLGVSALLGPLIGGYITVHYSWRAIFWFLAGFTVLMLPLVAAIVPESTLRVRERLDIVGAALLAAGATLTLIYLDMGHEWGWGKPSTLVWLIGGLALLALFPVVEFRARQPIMDMKLLFTPRVSVVLGVALLASFMIAYQSYATGYMTQTPPADDVKAGVLQATLAQVQQQTGHPIPAEAVQVSLDPGYSYGDGLSLLGYATHVALAQSLVAMLLGFLGGLWIRRSGGRWPLVTALAISALAAVAYAVTSHSWATMAVISAVYGIAFGLYYASVPNLIVEAVPAHQQGISAGMLGVMNAMGTAIGLAVATAILNENPVMAHVSVGGQAGPPQPVPMVYADAGYEYTFYFVAAAAAVALIGAVAMRHGRTPATGGTAY